MIKRFLSITLLLVGVQLGWGFALLGPIGNGGDSWQIGDIGYGIINTETPIAGGPVFLQDIGAPKNIGEGYRRNTPQVYYAYNANFLGFFGTDGATNVDGAFAIMNSLTNVSSYPADLSDVFPDNSQHFDFAAQSAALTDVKSVTLHLLVETMGLADPERYTWTLAERTLPTGGKCPIDEIYLVVQRNFSEMPTSPQEVEYSPYVNDVLYSYYIVETCTAAANKVLAQTVTYSVDPLTQEFTSVAANDEDGFGGALFSAGGGLQVGGYYTGLTKDDVAGLRYLYESNNIVTEDVATGSSVLVTNLPSPVILNTLSYGLFISQLTNDPATLLGLYPTLLISSVSTNFAFTNLLTLTPTFTNFPGTTVTNFTTPLQAVLITNIDLALFSMQAMTNSPGALQILYPQLQILSATILYFTNIPNPVLLTYITNGGVGSEFGSTKQVTVTNGFTPNIFPIYGYVFGNILTNYFAPTNIVTVQTISVTNLIGSPIDSSQDTRITSVNKVLTNTPSGDIFIIPTNWCGFNIFQKISTNRISSFTNTVVATGTTNSFGGAQFTQNVIFFYTNRIWAVLPGICEPTLIFQTNLVGTVLTNYQYSFANLFTNLPTMQFTNSLVTIITTNVGFTNGGTSLITNVITQTVTLTNLPSGDFFIIPPAWTCGFQILQVTATNLVGTTNTVVTSAPVGVTNSGELFSVTTISAFTNHTLEIQPFICQTQPAGPALREGVEKIQFIRANFDSLIGQFFQPITNTYSMVRITNSQAITESYQRVITTPDILLSADDQIAASPTEGVFVGTVARNINFDTANVLPGLAGPGTITGIVTFDYDKIGDAFNNGSLGQNSLTTNSFLSEITQIPALAWASFDGSTNPPEVYPNGNSIQNLQNQIVIQISPATLPNGTAHAFYSQNFTLSGGSLNGQLVWSASNLPPGLTFTSNSAVEANSVATLSGTPTQSGTYEITLQVTDGLGRTVQWFYTLIIQ